MNINELFWTGSMLGALIAGIFSMYQGMFFFLGSALACGMDELIEKVKWDGIKRRR